MFPNLNSFYFFQPKLKFDYFPVIKIELLLKKLFSISYELSDISNEVLLFSNKIERVVDTNYFDIDDFVSSYNAY